MASIFQSKIINKLKSKGWTVVSVVKLSLNGYPDILAMKQGKMLWIESKEVNDTLKPLQKLRIDELRANGFRAYCIKKGKGKIY
jgi:Holliday junction resolvase